MKPVFLIPVLVLGTASLLAAQEEKPDVRSEPETEFLRERVELLELRIELREELAELTEQRGRIERSRAESEREALVEQLDAKRAQYVLAEQELERTSQLFEKGVVSQIQMDRDRARVTRIRSETAAIKGEIESRSAKTEAVAIDARREAILARIDLVQARLELAEARFELRRRLEKPAPFRRPRRDDDAKPSIEFRPADDFRPAPDNGAFRPALEDERPDAGGELDVENGFVPVPLEPLATPDFDAGGGNRDFIRRNESLIPRENLDPPRRD